MARKKLQAFFSPQGTVWLPETKVKQVLGFSLNGDFNKLSYTIIYNNSEYPYGAVTFKYETRSGKGEIILYGEKVK